MTMSQYFVHISWKQDFSFIRIEKNVPRTKTFVRVCVLTYCRFFRDESLKFWYPVDQLLRNSASLDVEWFFASEIFVKILTRRNSIFHGKEVPNRWILLVLCKHSVVRAREFSINQSVTVWFTVKINRRTVVIAETRWASRIGRLERWPLIKR